MNKKDHITTLLKRDLKTRSYNMNMNEEGQITTFPKRGLKTRSYNMDMNKKDLKRSSRSQLIKLLLKQVAKKQITNEFDNSIASPSNQEKSVPHKSINDYEDIVLPLQEQFQDKKRLPKPNRPPPPPPPKDDFNFDDDIFQTENQSLEKFKIISVQSRENKKFKSYTNDFKVKILKKLDNVKEIYYIFQELVKTVKRRRKRGNDMLRLVIQNVELPDAISTKFNKVQDFKLGDLETIINT